MTSRSNELGPCRFFPIRGRSWPDYRDDPLLRGADDGVPGRGGWRFQRSAAHSHRGIDLRAPIGTPIIAAEDGTAEFVAAETNSGSRGWSAAGHRVRLSGTSGAGYLYLHLGTDHTCVHDAFPQGRAAGDVTVVAAGQIIGYLGHTGGAIATGQQIPPSAAHLHFEYFPNGFDGEDVNPARLLEHAITLPPPAKSVQDAVSPAAGDQ